MDKTYYCQICNQESPTPICASHVAGGNSKKNTKTVDGKRLKKDRLELAPFVAVAVDTTGIPSQGDYDLLCISMVFGDYGQLGQGIEKRLTLYIDKGEELVWQDQAREHSSHIAEAIESGKVPTVSVEDAGVQVLKFLKECMELSGEWRNTLVGINMDSMVIQVMKDYGFYDDELIDHNHMDFRSLFYFKTRKRMNLREIAKTLDVPLEVEDGQQMTTLDKSIVILSCMFEEMARATGRTSFSWY